MTSALKQVFDEASKLPDDEQDSLAAAVAEQLHADDQWDHLFKASGSSNLLTHLSDEAIQEHRRGETQPLDPDTL